MSRLDEVEAEQKRIASLCRTMIRLDCVLSIAMVLAFILAIAWGLR